MSADKGAQPHDGEHERHSLSCYQGRRATITATTSCVPTKHLYSFLGPYIHSCYDHGDHELLG